MDSGGLYSFKRNSTLPSLPDALHSWTGDAADTEWSTNVIPLPKNWVLLVHLEDTSRTAVIAAFLHRVHGWCEIFLVTGIVVIIVGILQGVFLINRPEERSMQAERPAWRLSGAFDTSPIPSFQALPRNTLAARNAPHLPRESSTASVPLNR